MTEKILAGCPIILESSGRLRQAAMVSPIPRQARHACFKTLPLALTGLDSLLFKAGPRAKHDLAATGRVNPPPLSVEGNVKNRWPFVRGRLNSSIILLTACSWGSMIFSNSSRIVRFRLR